MKSFPQSHAPLPVVTVPNTAAETISSAQSPSPLPSPAVPTTAAPENTF